MAGTNGVGRFGVRSYVAPVSLSSIVTNGLILNLDAGNVASYPGTGTAWTDLSGNGNNGTLVNGTSYSSANGGALAFDGINDYVSVNGIVTTSSYTISAWCKVDYANSAYYARILEKGINNEFTLCINKNFDRKYTFQFGDGNGGWLQSNTLISLSPKYDNVAITVENTSANNYTVKMYINGVFESSNTKSGTFNTNNILYIGGNKDVQGLTSLVGSIGGAFMYGRALSASEVLQNFNSTKERFGYPSYTTRTVAFATATGITDTTILNALNTFDAGLISNGLDTDLEVLYPFVGGTSTSHQYNFINPSTFPLTFNGGWIHSSTGAKPNGTNAYAQTGWVPSSRYSNGTTNGAWGTYIRQSLTAWPQFALGSYAAGSYFGLAGNNTTSQYWRVNGEANTTPATTSNKGMFQASRALTSTNMFVSQNSQQFELSGIFANGGIPNVEVYLASNNNGGAVQFGSQEQALAYLSKGKYTQAQQSAFYALVQAFQTSLSRAV